VAIIPQCPTLNRELSQRVFPCQDEEMRSLSKFQAKKGKFRKIYVDIHIVFVVEYVLLKFSGNCRRLGLLSRIFIVAA